MPNIRKDVHDRIVKMITEEFHKANNKIRDNKRLINKLSQEQTILKREKARLNQLLWEIKTK